MYFIHGLEHSSYCKEYNFKKTKTVEEIIARDLMKIFCERLNLENFKG